MSKKLGFLHLELEPDNILKIIRGQGGSDSQELDDIVKTRGEEEQEVQGQWRRKRYKD